MKIKDGFMLRKFDDNFIVVPLGDKSDEFYGLITLNETGAFIWDNLKSEKNEAELLSLLLKNYNVDEKTAKSDLEAFIQKVKNAGLIDD